MAVALGGLLFGTASAIIADFGVVRLAPYHAILPGGLIFVLVMAYANLLAFRCPRCNGNWGMLAMQGNRCFTGIDTRIRYCPFCGYSVDAEPQDRPTGENKDCHVGIGPAD